MSASSSRESGTPTRSKLLRRLSQTLPGRFVALAVRKPEYGVLYFGTAFWFIAGTLGIGRPLFSMLIAHV